MTDFFFFLLGDDGGFCYKAFGYSTVVVWLCGIFCETFFIYAFSLFVQLLQESGKREGIAVCVSYTRLGYGESSFQVP